MCSRYVTVTLSLEKETKTQGGFQKEIERYCIKRYSKPAMVLIPISVTSKSWRKKLC